MGFLSHLVPSHADNFKKGTFKRAGQIPIVSNVVCLVEEESSNNNAMSNYSGSVGRHRVYKAYLTSGGNLIVTKTDYSQWEGEHTRSSSSVYKSLDDLRECEIFNRGSWLEQDFLDAIKEAIALEIAEVVE